jgi:hypothetical protein
MFKAVKNKILQIHQATGIEICYLPEGEITINITTVKLVKNNVVKVNDHNFLSNLNELRKKISIEIPIALVISGKGVLFKQIAVTEIPPNPIEAVLPTANPAEFYVEITRANNNAFVSVIRKEPLDRLLLELKDAGFKLLSVSLCGFKVLSSILPLLEPENNWILTTYFKISKDKDNYLAGVTTAPFNKNTYEKIEYNIGDQYIYSSSLLSFSAAASLVAEPLDISPSFKVQTIQKERESFIYFKWYKAAVWGTLTSSFLLLFANFLIYNYYFTNNKEFELSHSLSNTEEEKKANLTKIINQKEAFMVRGGLTNHSRLSLLADRVASMVTESMILTSMKLNPVYSNDFTNDEITTFKKDTIEVTGICDDPTELSVFTENLKTGTIFKNVSINNYIYKKETGKGYFSIEIITK